MTARDSLLSPASGPRSRFDFPRFFVDFLLAAGPFTPFLAASWRAIWRALDSRSGVQGSSRSRTSALDTRSNISVDRCKTKRPVYASARKRRTCPCARLEIAEERLLAAEQTSSMRDTYSTVKSTKRQDRRAPSASRSRASRRRSLDPRRLATSTMKSAPSGKTTILLGARFFHLGIARSQEGGERLSCLFDVGSTVVLFPLGFSFPVVHRVVVAGPRASSRVPDNSSFF